MTGVGKNQLANDIIRIIIFFDIFAYPLTAEEAWQYLGISASLLEVREELKRLASLEIVQLVEGYYCLPGHEVHIVERKKRYNHTDRKFKRALFITKIFRLASWVKLVALSNQIGRHNLRDQGDIDLFIVAAENRLWLCRFWCVLVASTFGMRPNLRTGETRDTICLNFFVTDASLAMENLKLTNDPYFDFWLACLVPTYDVGGTYERLITQNSWLTEALPNWQPFMPVTKRRVQEPSRILHRVAEFIFGRLEPVVKKYQLKKLPPELKDKINLNNEVVVSDTVLKLHANDRRAEINSSFFEAMRKFSRSEF